MLELTERWKQLCEQAWTEENPTKLLKLIQEINDLLEQKHTRLLHKDKA